MDIAIYIVLMLVICGLVYVLHLMGEDHLKSNERINNLEEELCEIKHKLEIILR